MAQDRPDELAAILVAPDHAPKLGIGRSGGLAARLSGGGFLVYNGGVPKRSAALRREHAIVVGGGIAGLLAARVLARHFERVTVLDRDHLPEGPLPRAGAPQSHHVHVLLARGWRILQEMFPGLAAELTASEVPELDWLADVEWYMPFGQTPRAASPLRSRACTRALLEHTIRAAVVADGRVRVLDGVEVTGLRGDASAGVSGVHVQRRGAHAASPADEELGADLVVDASGRASRAPDWLQALGYEAPAETVIDAHLGYATRLYELGAAPDWKILYVMGKPPHTPRGGVIHAIEGGRFIVTLVGYGGVFPPTDEAGFLEFAGGLSTPALREALDGATPCSSIHGYRRTENRVRHYERLRRWPAGLLVLGDAACALNPVYGQGMTVSAIAATLLDAALRAGDELGLRFQRKLAASSSEALLTATSDDFRWPGTTGKATPGLKVMHRLVDRLLVVAMHDADVLLRLMEVLHLVRPAWSLFDPRILRRALLARG